MNNVQLTNLLNQLNISMGSQFKKLAVGWPAEIMATGKDNNYPKRKAFPALVIAPFRGTDSYDGERASTVFQMELFAMLLQNRTDDNKTTLDTLQKQWATLHGLLRNYVTTLQVYCINNGLAEITEPTFEYDSGGGTADKLVSVTYRFNVVIPFACVDVSDIDAVSAALDDLGYNSTQSMPTEDIEQLTQAQLIAK
jgi:hypothetical protein